jgi:hypothetical protein
MIPKSSVTMVQAELLPDGTCMLRCDGTERWRACLDFGEAIAWNPFREALVWPTARRVVAAASDRVHLLDLEAGEPRATLILSPDLFGHLALVELAEGDATTELLLVLGWTDVRAYDASASLCWHARRIAVDGITFDQLDGSILRVHAEMDPPGGWFSVSLDATTGHELAREPAFSPGYCGLYGEGPAEER